MNVQRKLAVAERELADVRTMVWEMIHRLDAIAADMRAYTEPRLPDEGTDPIPGEPMCACGHGAHDHTPDCESCEDCTQFNLRCQGRPVVIRVVDQMGGAIPAAIVEIRRAGRFVCSTPANADGEMHLSYAQPGTYLVTARMHPEFLPAQTDFRVEAGNDHLSHPVERTLLLRPRVRT